MCLPTTMDNGEHLSGPHPPALSAIAREKGRRSIERRSRPSSRVGEGLG